MADFQSRQTITKRPGAGRKKSAPHEDVKQYLDATAKAKGLLCKKSTKGKWQARWWELRGPYLMYWNSEKQTGKPSAGNKVNLPLQALDIRRFATESVQLQGTGTCTHGSWCWCWWSLASLFFFFCTSAARVELLMTSSSGHTFCLKPYSSKDEAMMEKWRVQIEKQIMKFESLAGAVRAQGTLEEVSHCGLSICAHGCV